MPSKDQKDTDKENLEVSYYYLLNFLAPRMGNFT